jgi:hypothetical protein
VDIMLYINPDGTPLTCTSPLAGEGAARKNLIKAIREQKPVVLKRIG